MPWRLSSIYRGQYGVSNSWLLCIGILGCWFVCTCLFLTGCIVSREKWPHYVIGLLGAQWAGAGWPGPHDMIAFTSQTCHWYPFMLWLVLRGVWVPIWLEQCQVGTTTTTTVTNVESIKTDLMYIIQYVLMFIHVWTAGASGKLQVLLYVISDYHIQYIQQHC